MSVNKAILLGNLGADPVCRYTPSGTPVTNFRIATNERWTSRDGTPQERTEWHRIVVFGKLAEVCRDYLSKGRQIFVEGRIQTREWTDRDNVRRFSTEIVAQSVRFLGGNRKETTEVPPEAEATEGDEAKALEHVEDAPTD